MHLSPDQPKDEIGPLIEIVITEWQLDVVKDVSAVLIGLMIMRLTWLWMRDSYLIPLLYRL